MRGARPAITTANWRTSATTARGPRAALAGRLSKKPSRRLAMMMAGRVDDLAHVVARVGERAMERFIHPESLAPNRHGAGEVQIVEDLERREEWAPAMFPMCEQLRLRDGPGLELVLAVAPGLLTVA